MPDHLDLDPPIAAAPTAPPPTAPVVPGGPRRPSRHPVLWTVGVIVVLLVVVAALFDWNWLREPLEHYVAKKTQREFRISDLNVHLGFTPVVTMKDVYIANSPWSDIQPMAEIKVLKFSLSLRDLVRGKELVPEVDVVDGHAILERTADGKKNWIFSDPNDTTPSKLVIGALHPDHFTLRYRDPEQQFDVSATANGMDTQGLIKTDDQRFQTRIDFKGSYKDAPFKGEALTANLITFEQTDQTFPLIGHVEGGTTSIDVNGTISDLAQLKAVDADVKIKGATMANLYPYLLLPLPASPPYQIEGKLDFRGDTYRYGSFHGRIGETDLTGDASYTTKKPRPLLQIKLESNVLNLADLGPLIGVQTKSNTGNPDKSKALGGQQAAKQSDTAQVKGDPKNNSRILPSGKFDPAKMRVIDAKVSLNAKKLKSEESIPVDSLSFELDLEDGILRLTPVDMGIAGGHIVGNIELNAQQQPIQTKADIEARGLSLERLLPKSPRISPSEGHIAASLKFSGKGDSIADAMANANGDFRSVVQGGQISNLADAAVGLNGGKVIRLLATGDQDIKMRCGAVDIGITNGIGKTRTFLLDTEQTEILGEGSVNFADEYFDLTLKPEPKHPDILSLRSPLHIYGPFAHPDFGVDKTAIAERAGATIALGLLNPLAALLPLLETGPGKDADCQSLLSDNSLAHTQGPTVKKSNATPAQPAVPPAKN
jgi:uncharacterized protein involved in outer membrane biogenesis